MLLFTSKAHLKKDESILMHNGAGAVCEVTIKLALHLVADVYTPVASAEEKVVVLKNGVPEDHMFDNIDLGCVKGIQRITNSRGVDVVYNSLFNEELQQSWQCIAPCGCFVELGRKDLSGNSGLDMAPLSRNVTFIGVNLLDLCRHDMVTAAKIFAGVWELLSEETAVELRNWMYKELGAGLSNLEILADEAMVLLAGKIARISKLLLVAVKEEVGGEVKKT